MRNNLRGERREVRGELPHGFIKWFYMIEKNGSTVYEEIINFLEGGDLASAIEIYDKYNLIKIEQDRISPDLVFSKKVYKVLN